MGNGLRRTRILSLVLSFILAMGNTAVAHAENTVSDGDSAIVAYSAENTGTQEIVRLGIDQTTQGHWEGTYGTDQAILYGYNHQSEELENATSTTTRYLIGANTYDLVVSREELDYTIAHTYSCHGMLQCFAVSQEDESILDMPEGVEKNKIKVIAASSNAGNSQSYTVKFSDDKPHAVSFYSAAGGVGNVVITFTTLDGEALLTDTIAESTFNGGAYVTYLVPGSFKMTYSRDNSGFSFSGSFFDGIVSNDTSELSVVTGDKAHSAKLTWKEGVSLEDNAKIIVERKSTEDIVWKAVATLSKGICAYQDEDLTAGEAYTYRLRTKVGASYSENGKSVTYLVPAYAKTILTLDKEGYSVSNAEETISIIATLTEENGNPCVNQSIVLNVDFGHAQQTVDAVLTDEDGNATFEFKAEYLGDAQVEATFSDNDQDRLLHASAEATLFVGETEWEQAPVLWRISEGIMPGNLVSLNGYGMADVENLEIYYAKHTSGEAAAEPTEEAVTLTPVNMDSVYGCYVVVQLPEDVEPGLYDFWIKNAYGYSNPMVLNAARALFMDEYEAWAGQMMMISGRNLEGAQFGFDSISKVRLVNGSDVYEQTVTAVTPYSLCFEVGTDVPLGTYMVEVSNDNGLTWGEMESGQTLTVVEVGKDPLNIGVSWAGHFNWTSDYIDVTKYGAVPNDDTDDTEAFQAALNAAGAQEGGGVVYIPDGIYLVGNLEMPAYVVVAGESTEGTVLKYYSSTGGGNMFGSTNNEIAKIGHNGYANFSIRLYDENIRPDGFFWLGHEWNNSYTRNTDNRTAAEVFISGVDLSYPTDIVTDGTGMRGMFYVSILKERFVIKDCSFVGYYAAGSNYVKQYCKQLNTDYVYEKSAVCQTATYNFIVNCTAKDADPSSDIDNHGFMMRQTTHFENCWAEGFGKSSGVNDGEAFCVEMPGGYFELGEVVNASADTVTGLGLDGSLGGVTLTDDGHAAIAYGRLSVWIVSGRGMGQIRDIEYMDSETGYIELTEEWDVIPDRSSKFTIVAPLDRVTVYNCGVSNTTKGVFMYGCGYDNVVSNNYLEDTEGIFLYSSLVATNRMTPNYFTTVRDNVLLRHGVESPFLHISVGSVRMGSTDYKNKYFGTNIYGIDVRNNILVNDKTESDSTGCTEAPHTSGLISWSTKEDNSYVSDGICGDNMNILWENNELQHFVRAMETTLGDYGLVYKGNTFKDVDTILENSNDAGTGNHVIDLESAPAVTKAILQNYVTIYRKADKAAYSTKAYELLAEVLTQAETILNDSSSVQSDYAFALQRLKIAASMRNVFEGGNEIRAILLSDTACWLCEDGDGDGKCDTCGIEIPTTKSDAAEIEVKIDNVGSENSGITVTAPTVGWLEGTNTFTVSCENACVVAVKNADGSYTRVKAVSAGTTGTYSYTITDMTDGMEIFVMLAGDINGDGQVNASDVTMTRAASLGNMELDDLPAMLADANGDGNINAADVTMLRAVSLDSYEFAW